MRSLHPSAADHSVSIRGSRCTALIMLLLRSRAGDLATQRWYSNYGDGTSPFPPSGNEGYIRNRDVPLQSVTPSHVEIGIPTKATQELPSSALCRPPDPSYKADDRTGLHREGQLLLSLEQPKQ